MDLNNMGSGKRLIQQVIESGNIKLNKPSFDYVVIKSSGDYSLATKLAKKGIVSLYDFKITLVNEDKNAVNTDSNGTKNTEVKPTVVTDK